MRFLSFTRNRYRPGYSAPDILICLELIEPGERELDLALRETKGERYGNAIRLIDHATRTWGSFFFGGHHYACQDYEGASYIVRSKAFVQRHYNFVGAKR